MFFDIHAISSSTAVFSMIVSSNHIVYMLSFKDNLFIPPPPLAIIDIMFCTLSCNIRMLALRSENLDSNELMRSIVALLGAEFELLAMVSVSCI